MGSLTILRWRTPPERYCGAVVSSSSCA
jgi:hypothetical protein